MAQWHRDVLIRLRGRTFALGCACAVVCLGSCLGPSARAQQPAPPPPPPSIAEDMAIVILPTLTPTGEMPSPTGLRRLGTADGVLWNKARELDLLLRDTAQDLGFLVNLSSSEDTSPTDASERVLIARGSESNKWQLSPRIEYEGSQIVLRFLLVPAGADHAIVRTESTGVEDFQVRAVVMLRDLVRAGQQRPALPPAPAGDGRTSLEQGDRRSEGRAVLVVHAAAFGGFVGYSLQKSSGSDDVRLTYPLMALGTGVGLGGSLIIAEEWDVGLGDAWYMSAGALWPTFGGLMLARGRDVQPETDRYAWGLGGGLAGITLASLSLSFAGMAEGGAAVAHSGGFIGTGLGAGTEMAIRGKTDVTPFEGLGYGALAGVLIGGAIGRGVEGSPSRIMLIDVGVGLGALSFASVASPLLIGDTNENRERAWALLTMSGALAGGTVAYFMTAPSGSGSASIHKPFPVPGQPILGVIGQSQGEDGTIAPAYGVGWTGAF